MQYFKQFINTEGDFIYIKEYPDGRRMQVSSEYSGLTDYLQNGGAVTEIPYTPPQLPDLEVYKQQKIDAIKTESATRCTDLTVYRIEGVPEKFTVDVRSSLHAAYSELTFIATQRALTSPELAQLEYLNYVWGEVKAIQTKELEFCLQVLNASTHAEVDAVVWE